jgi:flagellar biosynthesis protein FlhG
VLPGRSGAAALAALDAGAIARLLGLLRALPMEVVVLDLGAGLGPAQRRLAVAADVLGVVATEEPTSLTDAYAVLKLHRQDGGAGSAGVLANLVANGSAAQRVHAALDRACRSFLGVRVALLGYVRRDARIPAAIRAQQPLLTRYPATPAAEDLRALAAVVEAPPLARSA